MEGLRGRYDEAQKADQARNGLIEDLLQRVADMQKQMDRHGFVLVLIDGDCMNFLNELVQQGIPGGEEAGKRLRRAVFEYLRYDEDFKHDYKIVVRVYANLRGLSKAYFDNRTLPTPAAFSDFVLGFNKANPLCDFVDAGNHKEAADTKLKETLSLYVYNVHCKHIIFGASADNGYASFLSSAFDDTNIPSRLRLLKGPPFSYEFQSMLSKFKWTEFKTVFRSELIPSQPKNLHARHRSVEVDEANARESSSVSKSGVSALPWRPKVNSGHDSSNDTRQSRNPSDLLDMSSDSSGRATPIRTGGPPGTGEVVNALIGSTLERLEQSPLALDFGVVKSTAARKLGVSVNFWGTSDQDEWFSKSKIVIKKTVENWIEATDNPPPKNATWMLRYFKDSRSASATIKSPSADAWRTKLDFEIPYLDSDSETPETPQQSKTTTTDSDAEGVAIDVLETEDTDPRSRMGWNAQGERIDLPTNLRVNPKVTNELRDRKLRLCNNYHLLGSCRNEYCPYDHKSILTYEERKALMLLSRSYRCTYGSACYDEDCAKGHMCPAGKYCTYGSSCRFADMHGMDTQVKKNEA